MDDNHLGDFLRARRAGLRPEDIGMASYGTRRVAGLRREEVAVLSGMNADYCTRLEQGRERNPSPQVLDALSRALRLEADARTHLYRLAGAAPADRPSPYPARHVTPALHQLMDGYPNTPAFVLSPALDLLAVNALAEALFTPFRPADNLARMVFADPAGRSFYTDWNGAAEATVTNLRQATGHDPDHPRLRELVRTSPATARTSPACGAPTPYAARPRTPSVSCTRTSAPSPSPTRHSTSATPVTPAPDLSCFTTSSSPAPPTPAR